MELKWPLCQYFGANGNVKLEKSEYISGPFMNFPGQTQTWQKVVLVVDGGVACKEKLFEWVDFMGTVKIDGHTCYWAVDRAQY